MCSDRENLGRVNSIQTLGTLDGPGVRFVLFVQGCCLRCGCCHNPETWDMQGGTVYKTGEILNKVLNYREYFGAEGGITVSGGEPLLQPEFVASLFKLCRENGINTCLDTSGCIFNEKVKAFLEYTDYVMLDIKYTTDELYKKYVGCSIKEPLQFLDYLNRKNIPTRIRQVIIPGINDNEENIKQLAKIIKQNSCVVKTELLPFKKMCEVKYKKMGIEFPFANIPPALSELILKLENALEEYISQ